jgi:hypothetical protein
VACEFTSQLGSTWLEIVTRPTIRAFAQAFSPGAILETTVAEMPLRGVESLYDFFCTTRSMYDRIAFVQEMQSDRRVCLEWEGVFQGKDISGVTILTYGAQGAIERIRLFHFPYEQLNSFSVELARRQGKTRPHAQLSRE